MMTIPLPVRGGCIAVREMTGDEERAVRSADTRAAVDLLSRLILDGDARSLTASDRDRILAELYISFYGSRIQTTTACDSCGKLFDLNFVLPDLIEKIEREADVVHLVGDSAGYRTPRGTLFRLPSAEAEIAADSEEALLARCILDRAEGDTVEDIEAAMQAVAPLIDIDLDAVCPECGRSQLIRFDVQTFFLDRLVKDRRRLFDDVHVLASTYGWSLNEILSLHRSERTLLIDLLAHHRRSEARAWA